MLRAARGNPALYIDIHQNAGSRIEVASVGISKAEAAFIKDTYRALRDGTLAKHPEIAAVELSIEPLDGLKVGAWQAKRHGILSVVKRGLHFELPSDGVMASSRSRKVYTSILEELIRSTAERIASVQHPNSR